MTSFPSPADGGGRRGIRRGGEVGGGMKKGYGKGRKRDGKMGKGDALL